MMSENTISRSQTYFTVATLLSGLALVFLVIGFGDARLINSYWPFPELYLPVAILACLLFTISIFLVLHLVWAGLGSQYRLIFWPLTFLYLLFALYVGNSLYNAVARVLDQI